MSEQHPYMTFNLPALTQVDKETGIAFDFNYGARVQVPKGKYHVRLIDRDACLTIYEADADGVIVTSTKKFYVNFAVEVSQQEDHKVIFQHDYDCRGRKVRMKFRRLRSKGLMPRTRAASSITRSMVRIASGRPAPR